MTKTIFSFIGGFIVGFLLIWGWNAYIDKSTRNIEPQTTTPEISTEESQMPSEDSLTNESVTEAEESESVSVSDQAAGDMVIGVDATLETDGWIVVHEEQDGRIGNALGAVRRDVGTHENVSIPLLRGTTIGSRYWIVLYSDDGDRQFNLETDFALRDTQGDPIISSFMAQ